MYKIEKTKKKKKKKIMKSFLKEQGNLYGKEIDTEGLPQFQWLAWRE